jgi:hypothetical protein
MLFDFMQQQGSAVDALSFKANVTFSVGGIAYRVAGTK